MKQLALIGGMLVLAAGITAAQAPPPPTVPAKGLVECLTDLTAEVRNLRLELVEQRLERQEETISQLHGRAQKVKADQQSLDDRERATARELEELTERLSQAGLDQEERTQLEQLRTMAMTSGVQGLAAERSSMAQAEVKIHEQLEREQKRRQSLLDTARQLRAKSYR